MGEKLFSDPYTGMNDVPADLQQQPSSSFEPVGPPTSFSEDNHATLPAFALHDQPGVGIAAGATPVSAEAQGLPEVVSAVPPGYPAAEPAPPEKPRYLSPRARASLAAHDAHRKAQLEEVKTMTSALEHGVSMLDQMPEGDARTKFIDTYAARLDSLAPGMGDTFRTVAEKPVLLTQFQQYMPYLTEPMKIMAQTRPRDFLKFVGTADGQKQLETARERQLIEGPGGATAKARTIVTHFQQLAPPEMASNASKDGRITLKEFTELNEYLTAQGSPAALTQEQMNAAGRAGDSFYTPLGILSPKHEQEVMAQQAKDKLKPGQQVDIPEGGTNFAKGVYDPNGTLFPGAEHNKEGFAILGRGKKEGTKFEFPPTTSEVTRAVDGKPHKFKISISADGKVQETDLGEVAPPPKAVDPVKEAIRAAMEAAGKGKGEKPPAAATKTEAPKVDAIDVAKRFNADAAMRGRRLGKEVPGKGFEVLDPKRGLVGYYR